MAWIEFHTALRDHWKIQRLADELNMPYTQALGSISCLWLWCVENSPKGDLTRFTDYEICCAMRLKNDSLTEKNVKNALKRCELIDEDERINDWAKHGIKLLVSSRKRMRKYRNLLRNKNVTVACNPSNQPNLSNQPNQPIKALSSCLDLDAPILYLNEKTKSKFDPKNKATIRLVKARYNEGRTLDDFKNVIDKKCSEWLTNEKMLPYLRPSTLFNATNFENYINQNGGKNEWDKQCFRSPK